jgi:hypothetical protein
MKFASYMPWREGKKAGWSRKSRSIKSILFQIVTAVIETAEGFEGS